MYRLLLILSLSALACGVNTQLPYSQDTPEAVTVYLSPISEPVANRYEVTAETLRIRDGAGEKFLFRGYLPKGEIVTCSAIEPALDGGLWCKHDKGYSNIRYMVQK